MYIERGEPGTPADDVFTLWNLHVDAEVCNIVNARIRCGTASALGRLYWTTDHDPVLSYDKSQTFQIEEGNGEVVTHAISLTGHAGWSGIVRTLRIQLAESPAALEDRIHVAEVGFSRENETPFPRIGIVDLVEVGETAVTVSGTVRPEACVAGRQLTLHVLAPYARETDAQLADVLAVTDVPLAEDGRFTFVVDRYDNARDRYYCKFLVSVTDVDGQGSLQHIDYAKFATDIAFAAKNDFPYPPASSKKGIIVEMTDDAEELGIAHALLNITINNMILPPDRANTGETIPYAFEGITYHFNRPYLEFMDRQIKLLSDNGTIVNLVLNLYDAPDEITGMMIHPDAVKIPGMVVYAFNVVNEDGVRHLKAAIEFLVARYTREDQKYGRVVGYIVGNEVDAQWDWQNMGDKSVHEFVSHYELAVRLVYLAARKIYGHARIYISLTNNWMKPHKHEPQKYYRGRDIVDLMNLASKRRGDYPWHVAFHAYPEDFFNLDTWDDHKALDTPDTPHISFKNLQVLSDYMGRDELQVRGQRRKIILSEQGFHTPDDSPHYQELQAAAYAYAYYKSFFLPHIDAFILFTHVDIPYYGLNMGLWTQDTDQPDPFVPKNRKRIYEVFKHIDTKRSLEVTEFAKDLIGIADWQEIAPGFDPVVLAVRTPPAEVPLLMTNGSEQDLKTAEIGREREGWAFADNSIRLAWPGEEGYAGEGALQLDFTAVAKKRRCVVKTYFRAHDATLTPVLALAIKLTGTSVDETYTVVIQAYGADGDIAVGTASVNPADGWYSLALDLGGWPARTAIRKLKIGAAGSSTRTWNGSLLIERLEWRANVPS